MQRSYSLFYAGFGRRGRWGRGYGGPGRWGGPRRGAWGRAWSGGWGWGGGPRRGYGRRPFRYRRRTTYVRGCGCCCPLVLVSLILACAVLVRGSVAIVARGRRLGH